MPDLCQSHNFLIIAQLSLKIIERIEHINGVKNDDLSMSIKSDKLMESKIQECYDIITGLVTALNQSISQQKDYKQFDHHIYDSKNLEVPERQKAQKGSH